MASQNENSKITINDGYFETTAAFNEDFYVINRQDGWAGKIIIYGGQYKNFNPANNGSDGANTNYVAEGYESIEGTNNIWSVKKAA